MHTLPSTLLTTVWKQIPLSLCTHFEEHEIVVRKTDLKEI